MIDTDPIIMFCTLNPIPSSKDEWDNWNIEMQTTTADKNYENWANGKLALSDHLPGSSPSPPPRCARWFWFEHLRWRELHDQIICGMLFHLGRSCVHQNAKITCPVEHSPPVNLSKTTIRQDDQSMEPSRTPPRDIGHKKESSRGKGFLSWFWTRGGQVRAGRSTLQAPSATCKYLQEE